MGSGSSRNAHYCLPSQSELRELNLPASLEALERPIGLPPSLLKRAEEVRNANGPTKLEASIEDVQKLSRRDLRLLDEVTIVGHRYTENNSYARPWMFLTTKLLKTRLRARMGLLIGHPRTRQTRNSLRNKGVIGIY